MSLQIVIQHQLQSEWYFRAEKYFEDRKYLSPVAAYKSWLKIPATSEQKLGSHCWNRRDYFYFYTHMHCLTSHKKHQLYPAIKPSYIQHFALPNFGFMNAEMVPNNYPSCWNGITLSGRGMSPPSSAGGSEQTSVRCRVAHWSNAPGARRWLVETATTAPLASAKGSTNSAFWSSHGELCSQLLVLLLVTQPILQTPPVILYRHKMVSQIFFYYPNIFFRHDYECSYSGNQQSPRLHVNRF